MAADGVDEAPFFANPFAWLVFSLGLLLIPVAGWLVQSGWPWERIHPAMNALLNGTSTVFLLVGYWAVRTGRTPLHARCMIGAVTTSTVFLASYIARYALSGTHRYPGAGVDKAIYLIILFSHMILAGVVLPMVVRAVYLAWRRRFVEHRAIARWTWPIWIYVSITGVMVYLMLYPLASALYS